MRRVLLIAYHFPPISGSSGMQRTLRFAQYLPEFGWEPTVLSVRPSAYEATDTRSLVQVPMDCDVVRTRCLDAGRHLSVLGWYPRFAALPDRWASWRLWGVNAGVRLVRERRIQAVWSTYPIATAHMIGNAVARRSGVPWIADFRDPMAQEGYPEDPRRWKAFKRIEESAASRAARMVFVTPTARRMYLERYPSTPPGQFILMENGFDTSSFDSLEAVTDRQIDRNKTAPVLLHSGIVYPSERDPGALFEALGRLAAAGRIRPGDFVLRFRAPVHESLLTVLARQYRVEAFIEVAPAIPYQEALREMLQSEALLVMQGANCNGQIPAKVYEYLRAGRPILVLADPQGDTGQLLSGFGLPLVTPLESADAIVESLPAFLESLRSNTFPVVDRALIDRYSRRALTSRLAALLDDVVRERR